MAKPVSPLKMSIEQFHLITSEIRPAPEWVDGRIRLRPFANFTHGYLHGEVGAILMQAGLWAAASVTCEVGGNFLVPDVAVWDHDPIEDYPSNPPLVAAEILSPGNSDVEMQEKCREYAAWGAPNIWLVDPNKRELLIYRGGKLVKVDALELPDYKFRVTLADLLPPTTTHGPIEYETA